MSSRHPPLGNPVLGDAPATANAIAAGMPLYKPQGGSHDAMTDGPAMPEPTKVVFLFVTLLCLFSLSPVHTRNVHACFSYMCAHTHTQTG